MRYLISVIAALALGLFLGLCVNVQPPPADPAPAVVTWRV